MAHPPEIDPEAWERAGLVGEKLARKHVAALIMRRLDRGAHPGDAVAVVLGVISECSAMIRVLAVSKDDVTIAVLERAMTAHVRGAIRGAEIPLNEDGSPYEG